jgi:RimJ/RimL family protein N-acetyltransferase
VIEAMKRSDVVFVSEDDPRCTELETVGYEVVGYSWGANLRFDDSSDLAVFDERVRRVCSEAFNIHELASDDLGKVAEVELANANDYPESAATHHEMPTIEHLIDMIHAGVRFWGGFLEGELVAVTCLDNKGERWNTEFTSVLAKYRGRGFGTAVKAVSISALFNEGVRCFSTGGAASNEASLGANRTLGYVLEPTWRTYSVTHE